MPRSEVLPRPRQKFGSSFLLHAHRPVVDKGEWKTPSTESDGKGDGHQYGRKPRTPIRAKAQDTRANPNSWETHLVRKRWDIGLLRALSLRIMMMMMMNVNPYISTVYIHNAGMQEFTSLSYSTSEQHKELTSARMSRDLLDLQKISSKLIGCSPFSPELSLRNIVNGVVAHELVSVHENEEVARAIMHNMIGKPVFTFTFRRKDKAIAVCCENCCGSNH